MIIITNNGCNQTGVDRTYFIAFIIFMSYYIHYVISYTLLQIRPVFFNKLVFRNFFKNLG